MSKDQAIGAVLLVGGIAGILIYGWILLTPFWDILLKLTGFVAVAFVLGIVAWIGYTLATTPPPKPIEEIEKEVEKEVGKEVGKEEVPPPPPSEGGEAK
jgi:predicted DNA-binding transcriptional regulator